MFADASFAAAPFAAIAYIDPDVTVEVVGVAATGYIGLQ